MENSNIDVNIINIYLLNLFCILRRYLNLKICSKACINITYKMLTDGNNEDYKNLITEQMDNIIKNNDFKCDNNLTHSFLENVIIPEDNGKEEWKSEQNKYCNEKNFITCKLATDCIYENSNCIADESKYSKEKLEQLKNATKGIELNQNESNDFKSYADLAQSKEEWVDRISNYCDVKDPDSCRTSNNGCTKPLTSDKCIPDVKDFDKRTTLNYNSPYPKLNDEQLENKKKQRVEWMNMQDIKCNKKNMAECSIPNNDCKYENSKCTSDIEQYSDEKLIKMNNQKKVKEYLNKQEKNEWTGFVNEYCKNKDYLACSTKNNACSFSIMKQKCFADESDYKNRENLEYIENLEEILNVINAAESANATKTN